MHLALIKLVCDAKLNTKETLYNLSTTKLAKYSNETSQDKLSEA